MIKTIIALLGAVIVTGGVALAAAGIAQPPPVPTNVSPASDGLTIVQVLIVVEKPPIFGDPFPIQFYVFVRSDGATAIATPDDMKDNRAVYDSYMQLKLLNHYQVLVVTPKAPAPVTCT